MRKDGHVDTLTELITTSAQRFGGQLALTYAHEKSSELWTYADVYQYTRRVALRLRDSGIEPGDRVLLCAPNGPHWVCAFFGCMLAGAIVVPLDTKSPAEFVRKIAAESESRRAVVTRAMAPMLQGTETACLTVEGLDDELPPDDPAWQPFAACRDDVAELVYTSGTTGAPKGVILSHGNILSDLEAAGAMLGDLEAVYIKPHPDKTFRMLSLLPLSHMFEQICELFYVISLGAAITYVDSLQPATIFRAMREGPVTGIPVVPQVLDLFMSGLEREVRKQGKWARWQRAHRLAPLLPMPLRRRLFRTVHARLGGELDFFLCGGARLDPKLAQRWENLGIKVVIGYGVTEASPVVAVNALAHRNLCSVGRPLACNALRLAPDGEVLLRGANLTRGYWHDEAATAAAFDQDGWYHTGDLGTLDRGGHLYLRGRKKNMIVLANGLNVYPEDVEAVLLEQAGVRDAVVLGRERGAEVELHAVLLLEGGVEGAAVVKRANGRLAPHQRLKGQVEWGEGDFPRTPTLKPKRDEIARRAWG